MSINVSNNARVAPRNAAGVNIKRFKDFRIASFNCRTMMANGAKELISKTLYRHDIQIACLSEVRLPQSGSELISPPDQIGPMKAALIAANPTVKYPCLRCLKNAGSGCIPCCKCNYYMHLRCANLNYAQAKEVAGKWRCSDCDSSPKQSKKYKLFWSGPTNGSGLYGVAIMVDSSLSDAVMVWEAVNSRLMSIRISTKPLKLAVIAAYAPTNAANDDEKDRFYNDLDVSINKVPKSDFLAVCGDFNAKIGPRVNGEEPFVGCFGVGDRNDNGERLVSALMTHDLYAANTRFKHKHKHIVTWKSPDGNTMNQIDYVLVRRRWKSSVMDARSFWGNEWCSDHALIRARIKLRFSTGQKTNKAVRYNVERLKDDNVKQEFEAACNLAYDGAVADDGSIKGRWVRLCYALNTAATETVHVRRGRTNTWISSETLGLIQDRQVSRVRSKQKDDEIKRALHADKDKHWNRIAQTMEHATAVGDSKRLFDIIKSTTRKHVPVSESVRDKNGVVLETIDQKNDRWCEHFSELLNRPPPSMPIDPVDLEPRAPLLVSTEPPTNEEVSKAIRRLKNGKAPGEDGLNPELWKNCGDHIVGFFGELIRQCWKEECIPDAWYTADVIPLFKKGDRSICKNYRGISLLDLALKVFEAILVDRIKPARDVQVRETQAGFRPGRGCIDQVFALRQLLERREEYKRPFVIAFVDFSAAFDSIDRPSLWKLLIESGLPVKLVKLFQVLYQNTKCRLKVYNQTTRSFDVKTGVRQGAIASPLLFNYAIDFVLNVALSKTSDGADIGDGRKITDLTFADDIALIAESQVQLQDMLNRIVVTASKVGLIISAEKTKIMHCCSSLPIVVKLDGKQLEQIDQFKYLGSEISANGDASCDISSRIAKASSALNQLNSLWHNRRISMKTKRRVYFACIRPVLIYGCETWPLKKEHERKLDAFEHRAWRRILRISYRDRVTNIEVRNRFKVEETVSTYIRKRRLVWFGHVARMPVNRWPYKLMTTNTNMQWKRPLQGVRKTWARKIQKEFDIPPIRRQIRGNHRTWKTQWMTSMVNLAQDRETFKRLVNDVVAAN